MRLAVIPARGGSKRIPRKNLAPVCGRPLIAYSIDNAKNSGLFDEIIVSTDDEEIADVARALGASVPFMRPAEIADDHATTLDVMAHAARWQVDHGEKPTQICCLYATAALCGPDTLRAGLDCLESGGWDYVFAAREVDVPVQRTFARDATGAMRLHFPEHLATRTQDLAPSYHDLGQFYWGTSEAWLDRRPIFGKRTSFVAIDDEAVTDVDRPADLAKLELSLRERIK